MIIPQQCVRCARHKITCEDHENDTNLAILMNKKRVITDALVKIT